MTNPLDIIGGCMMALSAVSITGAVVFGLVGKEKTADPVRLNRIGHYVLRTDRTPTPLYTQDGVMADFVEVREAETARMLAGVHTK